jgi:hypothetical protein
LSGSPPSLVVCQNEHLSLEAKSPPPQLHRHPVYHHILIAVEPRTSNSPANHK